MESIRQGRGNGHLFVLFDCSVSHPALIIVADGPGVTDSSLPPNQASRCIARVSFPSASSFISRPVQWRTHHLLVEHAFASRRRREQARAASMLGQTFARQPSKRKERLCWRKRATWNFLDIRAVQNYTHRLSSFGPLCLTPCLCPHGSCLFRAPRETPPGRLRGRDKTLKRGRSCQTGLAVQECGYRGLALVGTNVKAGERAAGSEAPWPCRKQPRPPRSSFDVTLRRRALTMRRPAPSASSDQIAPRPRSWTLT